MNPLDQYPAIRKILYIVQWTTTGLQGTLSAVFVFVYGTPDKWPMWFLIVLAASTPFWAYFGKTASGNVPDGEAPPPAALMAVHVIEPGVIENVDDTPPTEDEIADLPTDEPHGGLG